MLSKERIEQLIKNPVSSGDLDTGVSIQNNHKLHITGDGYNDRLNQIKGFESKDDWDIRRQLTKPATIQLCALILDNLNRWVTNQGTVKIYNFKQEKQIKDFKAVLDNVWRGGSMDEFIKSFYKEAIYQESQGFLLVTKPKILGRIQVREGVELPYDGGSVDPYILFIAAEDVHDFHSVGDNLEYLIIDLGEDDGTKYYRVIDDTQDTIVTEKDDRIELREQDIQFHGLTYTPAIQVSGITKNIKNDKIRTSPIDHVIPALHRYMQKDSDLIIQMVRHMYPKLASVTTACKNCDGEGYYFDKETKVKCKDCNGTGKVIPISRDGIIGLPQFIDEGKTPYPGSPASYITPDNASLEVAIQDLKDLAQEIMYSATGDKALITEGLQTATENLINFKGLEDRISEIVGMVETREEFLVKTIALSHNDFSKGFEGVSIRYGRRLVLRGENEIITEINQSKTGGMPVSHITALQKELIYAKYKNNKAELERQQLLADVEPLNGYAVSDIKDISQYISKDDLEIKYNFGRLVDQFEAEYGLIQLWKKDQEWNKRVQAIYDELKKLKDEVLFVSGQDGQDGGPIVPDPIEEST